MARFIASPILRENSLPLTVVNHAINTQLNRRHILRGTGALIALPAVNSIGFRRFASAAVSGKRRGKQSTEL